MSITVSILRMRSKLERIRRLLGRYRVDRRLPPPVTDLLRTRTRLQVARYVDGLRARSLPVLGSSPVPDDVGRLGGRRLATAGPLTASVSELAVDTADRVERALIAGGVEAFLTGRTGDRLMLGVRLVDRSSTSEVVAAALTDVGWYVQWFDRSRSGVVACERAADDRRVRVARTWRVFRAYQWGERVIGPEAAVEITFWEVGASREFELVGTRSHERFHPDSADTTETVDGRTFRGKAAFPVSDALESFAEPVDVVFTWVDGSDPSWLASFRRAAEEQGRELDDLALDPARYRSRDELRYALRSVWAYCGWVRRIYVVTAGQRPAWLTHDSDALGLTIVDHAEILPADALPTFNSHAIEASLHHIDGLTEHFIYFNDDVFIARPQRPERFFTPNGLARVFQGGARVHGFEDDSTQSVDTAALRGRELLRRRFGRVASHKPLHVAFPLRRSTLFEIDEEFPDEIHRTRASRFRAPSDLSVAASFGQHYGLARGQSVLGEIASEYVHVESGRLGWHLDRIRLADDLDAFCINETRDGHGVSEREAMIEQLFRDCFPVAAPWERDG
ncbi:stealth conserved region 3 domain-containing protein [Ilumatobacter sp.]|uniref:stealth family protein n=1 Tax=Ilumatobacter sp. TaxID=1967498 RepID=UPI003AF4FFA7